MFFMQVSHIAAVVVIIIVVVNAAVAVSEHVTGRQRETTGVALIDRIPEAMYKDHYGNGSKEVSQQYLSEKEHNIFCPQPLISVYA